jgi:hypothetical protein
MHSNFNCMKNHDCFKSLNLTDDSHLLAANINKTQL